MQSSILHAWAAVLLLTASVIAEEDHKSDSADFMARSSAAEANAALSMLPGIAQPSQQVTLSAPLDGVLMSIDVREGSTVKKDQIVAMMDNRIAAAELRLAEAASQRTAAVARGPHPDHPEI